MNGKLFKQIINEWRSNLWLCVELLIVSVVMWYIVDYIHVNISLLREPLGFNIERTFLISVDELTDKSPERITDASEEETISWYVDMENRLRRYPSVEFVARGINSRPYNGSNSGVAFDYDTIHSAGDEYRIWRQVSPDFAQVFGWTGVNGETSEQLADLLRKGNILISENLLRSQGLDAKVLLGKDIFLQRDSSRTYHVGAIVKTIKYADFMQGQMNNTIITPFFPEREPWLNSWAHEWVVKVKPGQEAAFAEQLRGDADKLFRVGNLFIGNVKPMSQVRRSFLTSDFNEFRNMLAGMGFLLLNIFLGLLGTFWFRTQQRTKDIALRKVSGATSGSIFRLLVGEGLLLLSVVTPLAFMIDVNLAHLELNQWYNGDYFTWGRVALCCAVSYAIMAVMIAAGVSIPARRAMRIAPSEALREE